jgi:two-component system C4-dicarboxylate transport sensor histidine kinase DctB
LQQSLVAAKKVEELILALRKQLQTKTDRRYFSLPDEINQVIKILNYKLLKNNLTVKFRPAAEIKIFGDPVRFSQIVLNLLSNAVDAYKNMALPDREPIKIELRPTAKKIYLLIKDRGAGIASQNLDKIFESFFTTKAAGEGLGLGLATTKNIVEKDFGGEIKAQNRPSQGAKFIIKFPNHYGNNQISAAAASAKIK